MRMELAKRLGRIWLRLTLAGLLWGMLLGAAYGVFFFIVGALFGLFYGGILGLILGTISGAAAAAVTGLFYTKIKVWQYEQYRRTIRTICGCVGFFGEAVGMSLIVFPTETVRNLVQSPASVVFFLLIPGVLAGLAAGRSGQRIAHWYTILPHPDSQHVDVPVSGWAEGSDPYAAH